MFAVNFNYTAIFLAVMYTQLDLQIRYTHLPTTLTNRKQGVISINRRLAPSSNYFSNALNTDGGHAGPPAI